MNLSVTDLMVRLKATLPARWFSDTTPTLDAVLNGSATTWAAIFQFIGYVECQTRLMTASDVWLDLYAMDFLGSRLPRRSGESDERFRSSVRQEIFRERATRNGVVKAVSDFTGTKPIIFEPWNTGDTGAYGSTVGTRTSFGFVYGMVGGWGSLSLPFQFFVTIQRPRNIATATLAGWNTPIGGIGIGAMRYGDLSSMHQNISDADIYHRVETVLPAGVIAWTRIVD